MVLCAPRDLLGRGHGPLGGSAGQGVTLIGAILAGSPGRTAGLADPRPVFAAAGSLTLLAVAVAWFAGLRREHLPSASCDPVGPVTFPEPTRIRTVTSMGKPGLVGTAPAVTWSRIAVRTFGILALAPGHRRGAGWTCCPGRDHRPSR